MRISHGAPEAHGHARFRQGVLDEKIGNAIFAVGLAFHGRFIDAVFHGAREEARHDRRADDAALPGNRPAVGIEPGHQLAVDSGPVKIVLHIVFAGPRHLHGRAGGFRNLYRLDDEILLRAAPKAAAQISGVHANLFRF